MMTTIAIIIVIMSLKYFALDFFSDWRMGGCFCFIHLIKLSVKVIGFSVSFIGSLVGIIYFYFTFYYIYIIKAH